MDWTLLIGPIVTGVITACVSGFSVYVVMSNRMAILETKMDNVQGQLEQQNKFFSQISEVRTEVSVLKAEQSTYWRRYDDMDKRVSKIEEAK